MWVQEDGVHWLVPFGQGWKGDKMADYRVQMSLTYYKYEYHSITSHIGLVADGLGNSNTAAQLFKH